MDPNLMVALLGMLSTLSTNYSNRQLSSEQRDWSESMQDKQNAYNTPSAQVQRLREAGISPNSLSMGNGLAVSGNTSASVSPYQLPQMLDPMSIASNSFLSLMQGMKSDEERKDINSTRDARIYELEQSANKYKAEIDLMGLDAVSKQIANEYAAQLYEVSMMKDLSEIGLNESNAKHLDSLTETNIYKLKNVLPQELQLLVDKHELNLLDQQEVVAQIQKLYSEVDLNQAKTDLTYEQSITEIDKQQNLSAQTDDLNNRIQLFLDTYDDVAAQIANESKLSKRQVKGYWINTILHGAATGAAVGGATAALMKAAAAM